MTQRRALIASLLLFGAAPLAAQPPADDLDALQERAMKAAVQKVAPSVVQIQTSGGLDLVGQTEEPGSGLRTGTGPTTGVIVAADGYIISSAFNFASKPTEIFVSVPGRKDRYVAKVVANDHTRMLTLLKIDADGLPVPEAAPRKDLRIGQWSLALGRTWTGPDGPPSVSIGIISALERIWGKAIQTDAKVSPVNYGGPLIDLLGRVQGILVPASPRGQDETAGHEWYDSGIGFAIPLEDVNTVLPRLKQGQDLHRGLLGFVAKGGDIYSAAPEIASVVPESAAAKAGLKAGDVIVSIDGVGVVRQAQVQHILGKKYEGDTIAVKVKRGTQDLDFPNLKLTGSLNAFRHAFLGILPVRDDPEVGVEVRSVYPKSPADTAGVKVGDRILGVGQGDDKVKPFSGRDELLALLNPLTPETEIKLEVERKEGKKKETLTLKLASLPETVPDTLPEPASHKKALEPRKTVDGKPAKQEAADKEEAKKVETGFLARATAARDHEYWLYVPEDYDPNVSYALVVWLHPAGKGKTRDGEDLAKAWRDVCKTNRLILLGPQAENETGWLVSESDFIRQTVREVLGQYTIDRQRVVLHGMGIGGQLAYSLGLTDRALFHGVAVTGSVLAAKPEPNTSAQRLAFFIVAGGKDPQVEAIRLSKDRLTEQRFPIVLREPADQGRQYLDEATFKELVRWIDSLDRL